MIGEKKERFRRGLSFTNGKSQMNHIKMEMRRFRVGAVPRGVGKICFSLGQFLRYATNQDRPFTDEINQTADQIILQQRIGGFNDQISPGLLIGFNTTLNEQKNGSQSKLSFVKVQFFGSFDSIGAQ